jgi:acylphosphatase
MNAPAVTRHLIVRGLVQGVGYRWSMVQAARRLGVRGWVRNRRDGSVEALACGSAAAVEALAAWARSGPDGAQVSALEVAEAPAPAEPPADFVQRETA